MEKIVLIDRSEIRWTGKEVSILIKDMDTDYVIRALAWCNERLSKAELSLSKIPKIYHEQALTHNGRRLYEWVEILSSELKARAKTEIESKAKDIEKTIAELETPQERLDRMKKEYEYLKSILEES